MTGFQHQIAPLAQKNTQLAAELRRLPELIREPGGTSPAGLAVLMDVFLRRTDRFESFFKEIFHVGRHHGRYCAPLQAVYWLAGEGRLDDFFRQTATGGPVLQKLLDWAWFRERRLFSERDIEKIIDGIRPGTTAVEYRGLRRRRESLDMQKYILEDFQDKPQVFDPMDLPMIAHTLERSRWQNYKAVCDRLNAPELLHYYLTHRLTYARTPARGSYRVFRSGRGQCTDAAYFSRDMLNRSGYRTFLRSVRWDADPWAGLHTGAGIIDRNGHYLLVANFNGVNRPSGPHARIEAVDRCLARGNRIVDRRWGAYFPPPESDAP